MDARERYEELVDDLLARDGDVETALMMGMPCVKRRGRMLAGFSQRAGAMVFKLPDAAEREAALALPGAHLFDPGGQGRPFREWVVVPPEHADDWPRLAERALSA